MTDADAPKGGGILCLIRDQLTQARREAAEIPWYDRDDAALPMRRRLARDQLTQVCRRVNSRAKPTTACEA